ncbi:MAG: TIGR03067 domain-containing protein, partial [Bryobacteraceae bacterium]
PKTLDLTFTAGPEKGNTSLGIYELDGDDWTICLTTRDGRRPKKFAAAPGAGHALETLKRGTVTAQAVAVEPPLAAGSATELEGEWSMVSGFMDGHPIDRSMVKYGRRLTRGNQTSVRFGPQVFMQATFTLDPSKSPRQIDLVHTEGMHAGKTQLGIYECDGKTLQLSLSAPGRPRPVNFEPGEDDGKTVAVWKFTGK